MMIHGFHSLRHQETQINGLGEIEGFQKLYVEHTAAAMSK